MIQLGYWKIEKTISDGPEMGWFGDVAI